jgi:HPt (histidine-containing phosphotransfer) domain-containing protein
LRTTYQQLGKDNSGVRDAGAAKCVAALSPSAGTRNSSNVIRSCYSDDPNMMKVVSEFVKGLPDEVRDLLDLLERNDLRALQRVVHQLHGSCGGYGFDALSEPAAKAEQTLMVGASRKLIAAEIERLIAAVRRIEGYDEANSQPAGRSAESV